MVGIGGLAGTLVALALMSGRGLGTVFGSRRRRMGSATRRGRPGARVAGRVAMFVLIGVANTVVDSSGLTLLQRIAPDEVLGRVMGLLETLMIAGAGLGAIAAPLLIALIGARGAIVATGLFLPALVLVVRGSLLRLDAAAPAPPGPAVGLLSGIPIFAPLPSVTIERLAGRLREVRVPAGRDVIRQGDVADDFYVIASGQVEVFEDGQRVRRQGRWASTSARSPSSGTCRAPRP